MSTKIKRVLISQPKPATEKSPYFDIAEKYNLTLDFRQFIKVEGLDAKEFRQQKISIPDYSAIVFTAKVAIDHFFSLCEELRITMPETMKYFCISESVALYLQKYIIYRKRKIFFSQTGKMDGLANSLTKHNKEKFLVPVSDVHNDDITAILDEKKVDYTKAIMYRTVSTEIEKDYIKSFDLIIFFSPLGIVSLFKNDPDFEQGDIYIACFGAATAKAVREAGLRLDCEAPQPGFPSMTAALEAFVKEKNKKK
ncbi:uroporphyrinogen-III synthase [Dysgonomonas sp. PH5-45]|uniref:uroporphyrinogen-III synthase n=1 Tax=unclassified Dysgonomonas TaxID=2630389 RepID=UPI0024733FFF|nr:MULTISPECIES: uroporphyrinogen-III synthase [unclassified Dysgonomonas]MDH6355405.1 uroporphyrinogen-III synthase [Dysgonomonas sp. PH5-45]MDH6388302.1 uroporphyrinogen-III synthase [Dysgonomonas sp. PH5-37]